MRFRKSAVIVIAAAVLSASGAAWAGKDSYLKAVVDTVEGWHAERTVAKVDSDRLTVHRIDLVDKKGVIRMTLAGDLPNPIVDGVSYKRSRPVGGMMLRDDHGNERGGIGYLPGFGAVFAFDHDNGEAEGFNVENDGTLNFIMAAKQPERHPEALHGHLMPDSRGTSAIQMQVTSKGVGKIMLKDHHDRPRLVLTVTKEGYGAIEFLNAKGKVIKVIAPEAQKG